MFLNISSEIDINQVIIHLYILVFKELNALLSVTPIIVESARLSLLNIKQQACPSILFKLDSKSFQNCSFFKVKLTT